MAFSQTKLAENFSRAAETYDQLATHQNQWMQRGMKWALTLFPVSAEVLDIGCGTGAFAELTKPPRTKWSVTGLDIAPGMLELAAKRCAHVVEASAENMPFDDAQFDGVFSSLTLQWVESKLRAFSEIARVLKPGGAAVIVTLGEQNLYELRALADKHNIATPKMDHAERYATAATSAGLNVEMCKVATEKLTYASAHELLDSIRAIGAGNTENDPKAMEEVRKKIGSVIEEYDTTYRVEGGVVATWQPVYLIVRKP